MSHPHHPHHPPPVVVGAGPAGVRAARTLVQHGLRPIVIDESPASGGQIYRRQPAGFQRKAQALYGFEAGKATALHQDFDGIASQLDYRPGSLVWSARQGTLDVWDIAGNTSGTLDWSHMVIATGATDRVLPVPGWTLPGVYTLGGAQVALKYQACAVGRRVVFAGSGPLLYLVAYQYARAGVKVAAIIDNARLADQAASLIDMARQPKTLLKGMYYVAWLQAHGVPIVRNARLTDIAGREQVQGVSWRSNGCAEATPATFVDCDAVALGYALRSETQLADLLECQFAFDALNRAYLPVRDTAGRASTPGVYLAGDGAGIMGADAAELAGERAALALLSDRGIEVSASRVALLEKRLGGLVKWRRGIEAAFPFPTDWAQSAPDDLVVCRCENITAGNLRAVARETGASELNRLKALSRVGMGRCQGRICAAAAAEILADVVRVPVHQVGRIRAQSPIKPLPMTVRIAPAPEEQAP